MTTCVKQEKARSFWEGKITEQVNIEKIALAPAYWRHRIGKLPNRGLSDKKKLFNKHNIKE